MTISLHQHITRYTGSLLAVIGLIFFGFLLFSQRANAAGPDEHLVNIHDGESQQTVVTSAKTVKEVLKRAGIELKNGDAAEPAVDAELNTPTFNINIYRARPVTVIDGNLRRNIISPYQSPKAIAESAGIEIYDEDELSMTRINDFISDDGFGMKLEIDRATPFNFELYGTSTEARTQKTTVGEMLKEKNVVLGANDGTSVPLDTRISSGMSIRVWRNGVQTKTEEQQIAFPVRKIQNPDKEVGFKEIQTAGVVGKKLVTYEVNLQNGKEVSRKEIQSVVAEAAKEQVEIVGTKNNYSSSLNEWLTALRGCETGGNYARNSGNGYYGAYQFNPTTWNSIAKKTGRNDLVGVLPSNASPADQDTMVIANTNATAGLSTQHPGCYKKLGLSNKPPAN